MRISEGLNTFRHPRGDFGWRCKTCDLRFYGYPVHEAARIDARDHFASTDHLLALKAKRETEQLIDTLFELVGIGDPP